MKHALTLLAGFVLLFGCGGGSGSNVPAEAVETRSITQSEMVRLGPLVTLLESNFMHLANPGTTPAQGIVLQLDSSPGAPPHHYTLSGTFDGNGDGHAGTTLTGSITYGADPTDFSTGWVSATGQMDLLIDVPLLGNVYQGTIHFSATGSERQLWGSGTATHPLTGASATVNVPANAPLTVRVAADANTQANACGYSLDGTVQVEAVRSTGTLSSHWFFSPVSSSVSVQNATFASAGGQLTDLPDQSVNLPCSSSGNIQNWAAVFDQDWSCLPRESGQARLTIAVTGADTLTISDEDPPGSGSSQSYTATVIGADAHAIRGFFIAGPAGSRYREDFTWTLAADGSSFNQFSTYTYFEGLNTGVMGLCAATARRVP